MRSCGRPSPHPDKTNNVAKVCSTSRGPLTGWTVDRNQGSPTAESQCMSCLSQGRPGDYAKARGRSCVFPLREARHSSDGCSGWEDSRTAAAGMSRMRRRLRLWIKTTGRALEDGSDVTREAFRPWRHHRRRPRPGDGVLRRVGSRGGGKHVRGGEFLDTVIGIPDSRTEIVMLRPPGGGTGIELSSFVRPDHEPGSPVAMANELGLRSVVTARGRVRVL